jgi:D-arabinose 5-phosphate isomerase GutQ/GTP-binding protein EngB required for normal cell division
MIREEKDMSSNQRVLKKISTPFTQFAPNGAVVMVNMVDPQINTMQVFLDAIKSAKIPYFCVANKMDLVDEVALTPVKEGLGEDLVTASMLDGRGVDRIARQIKETFSSGDRVAILGVFNSGKTSLISRLTGRDLAVGSLPGTTLEFTPYPYEGYTLIDTVGQVIDINKPMMVSVDLGDCRTPREKFARVLRQDAEGILASLETALAGLEEVLSVLRTQIEKGHKIVVTGAGASALVAMEAAGQGTETGLPILVFTNNFADAQPIAFSKGVGEEEAGLSRYIATAVNPGDVMIGISASGGTGFVYDTLTRCREKGAITVAITENIDTPLGHAADYVIKSNAKPEGPSSSKIQAAHLAIVHALLLTLADERGITADQSVGFMLPEKVATKKMGIK